MKNLNKKTAVILFNLGGPDKISSVKPFLFNLFNDKAIIGLPQPFRFFLAKLISSKREEKAQKIYSQIGGKSPLLDITISQAHALERELSFIGNFKVFVSMRYWQPFAQETIKKINEYNPSQIILLPLYPQFSSSTSGSSLKDFFLRYNNEKVTTKIACCYPTQPDFIMAHALLIKQTLNKFYDKDLSEFRFLFSAHGLPQKLINAGDPYVFQVTKTTEKIVNNLAELLKVEPQKINFRICYQSKVGPLKWTSPSLDYEVRRVAMDQKIPVIIPVAFVSDHSETLVELDIDYKKLAQSLGVKNYLRVPALNIEGHFIKSLFEICKTLDSSEESGFFSGQKTERICPKNFKLCLNPNPCKT